LLIDDYSLCLPTRNEAVGSDQWSAPPQVAQAPSLIKGETSWKMNIEHRTSNPASAGNEPATSIQFRVSSLTHSQKVKISRKDAKHAKISLIF